MRLFAIACCPCPYRIRDTLVLEDAHDPRRRAPRIGDLHWPPLADALRLAIDDGVGDVAVRRLEDDTLDLLGLDRLEELRVRQGARRRILLGEAVEAEVSVRIAATRDDDSDGLASGLATETTRTVMGWQAGMRRKRIEAINQRHCSFEKGSPSKT